MCGVTVCAGANPGPPSATAQSSMPSPAAKQPRATARTALPCHPPTCVFQLGTVRQRLAQLPIPLIQLLPQPFRLSCRRSCRQALRLQLPLPSSQLLAQLGGCFGPRLCLSAAKLRQAVPPLCTLQPLGQRCALLLELAHLRWVTGGGSNASLPHGEPDACSTFGGNTCNFAGCASNAFQSASAGSAHLRLGLGQLALVLPADCSWVLRQPRRRSCTQWTDRRDGVNAMIAPWEVGLQPIIMHHLT